MNKEWHERHRMPIHRTLEQRVEWHLEHQRECGCRPPPPKVREEIQKLGRST